MIKLYHGTSACNATAIMREGFRASEKESIWVASGQANYFYHPEFLAEVENIDEDAPDFEKQELAIRHAKESATTALPFSTDCRRAVIEITVSQGDFDAKFHVDKSNNFDIGAVVCFDNVPAEWITNVWMDEKDLTPLKLYFASCLENHSNVNRRIKLLRVERIIVEALRKADTCDFDDELDSLSMKQVYSKG